MTRRARLARLERQARDVQDFAPLVIWWADADAGLWREGVGQDGEEEGQTEAMTPEEVEDVRAEGGHRLRITGLPRRRQA